MKKRLGYGMAVLATLLIVALAYNPASAADYTKVGVKIGDTTTYRLSASTTTDNKTTISVYGIVGSIVYVNETNYHPSGSISSTILIPIDLVVGGFFTWTWLIASGLQTNDPIYSGSPAKINDTSTMSFGGASRSVNHMKISGGYIEVWWDQQTGLMVKLNLAYMGWWNYTMISTTAWSPSFFTTTNLIIIGVVLVIVLVVALVLHRRKGGKKRR